MSGFEQIPRHPTHQWQPNIVTVLFLTVCLHYLINPVEMNSAAIALSIRALAGVLGAATMLWRCRLPPRAIPIGVLLIGLWAWLAVLNPARNSAYLFYWLAIFGISFAIITPSASKPKQTLLLKSLDLLIWFWIACFCIQAIIFFATGKVEDFHQVLHPESEARLGALTRDAVLFRLSGVAIEPGTYCNWLYGLIILRGSLSGRLFTRSSILGVATMFGTFSAWGVIAGTIYFFALILSHTKANLRSAATFLLTAGALSAIFAYVSLSQAEIATQIRDYFELRAQLSDISGQSKAEAYRGFLQMSDHVLVVGKPLDIDFCDGCLSPQDAGIFINFAVRSGILVAILLFASIAAGHYRKTGIIGLVALAPIAFTKFFFYEPLFWLLAVSSLINLHIIVSRADTTLMRLVRPRRN